MSSTPVPKPKETSFFLNRSIRRGIAAFVALATLYLYGCSKDISGSSTRLNIAADTSLLTPEVARALTSEGLFVGATPSTPDALNESQVRAIARAWVRNFFPHIKSHLETQHGGSINQDALRDCTRVYYAETPFQTVQDVSDGGATRRTFGPWWLVPLCVGDEPAVLLGVAAYATDIQVQNGDIVLPKTAGGEFVWRGIPLGGQWPLPPEAAANAMARLTASKVSTVPHLLLPYFREGGPGAARWEIGIAQIAGQNAGRGNHSLPTRLFMGPPELSKLEGPLLKAASTQPDQVEVRVRHPGSRALDGVIVIRRKADTPIRFDAVEGRDND
jgi:hypothetical protein